MKLRDQRLLEALTAVTEVETAAKNLRRAIIDRDPVNITGALQILKKKVKELE
jgi:hypothetical protein